MDRMQIDCPHCTHKAKLEQFRDETRGSGWSCPSCRQDAPHPALTSMWTGLYDTMRAALVAYQNASSASKGEAREESFSNFLDAYLPNRFVVARGDVIDSYGHSSGQIDGVVVYSSASVLRLPLTKVGIVPAESAGAVFEIKSGLSGQWDEVERKFDMIAPLRRIPGKGSLAFAQFPLSVSFHVVALNGFENPETLNEKLDGLVQRCPTPRRVSLLTLDPLRLVVADTNMKPNYQSKSTAAQIALWFSYIMSELDRIGSITVPWARYAEPLLEQPFLGIIDDMPGSGAPPVKVPTP